MNKATKFAMLHQYLLESACKGTSTPVAGEIEDTGISLVPLIKMCGSQFQKKLKEAERFRQKKLCE